MMNVRLSRFASVVSTCPSNLLLRTDVRTSTKKKSVGPEARCSVPSDVGVDDLQVIVQQTAIWSVKEGAHIGAMTLFKRRG